MDKRAAALKPLIWLLALALLATALYYPFVIARASLGLGGTSPERDIVGTVEDVRSRNADQFCTGIVSSAEHLWLVSRLENDDREHPADSIRLGEIGPDSAESGGSGWSGTSRLSPTTSRLLRLEQNGQFREVAWLDDILCLTASPDGRTLFALTGLRPAPAAASTSQTQVLHSDDQGASWTAVIGAFMNPEETTAWSIRLHFHGDNELWSVDKPYPAHWLSHGQPSIGLAYSSDRGHSASRVRHEGTLLRSLEDI